MKRIRSYVTTIGLLLFACARRLFLITFCLTLYVDTATSWYLEIFFESAAATLSLLAAGPFSSLLRNMFLGPSRLNTGSLVGKYGCGFGIQKLSVHIVQENDMMMCTLYNSYHPPATDTRGFGLFAKGRHSCYLSSITI